jgi:hypothetical protein
MRDFNDAEANIQTLVASNLTLNSGVNLDRQCFTGISCCLSTNAKQQMQITARIHRLTSERPVTWHFLKTKDTFNDNQERLACQKWVQQMAAECALPDWLPDETREICLYEAIRTKWNQRFNRYAWEIIRSADGNKADLHTPVAHFLGVLLSLYVRLTFMIDTPENQKIWVEKAPFLVETLNMIAREGVAVTLQRAIEWLRGPDEKLQAFHDILMEQVAKVDGTDDDTKKRINARTSAARARAQKELSDALIVDSDDEEDDENTDEGVVEEQGLGSGDGAVADEDQPLQDTDLEMEDEEIIRNQLELGA